MRFYRLLILTAVLVLAITSFGAAQNDRAGEEINWEVLPGGSQEGSSTNFGLVGTIGQTGVGSGNSTSYNVYNGFLQNFAGTFVCDCTPGETNFDGTINILDIILLIDYKFKSGPAPGPYATCSGDANCDCTVNILDIILLIDYKFKSGPPPCSCDRWVTACGTPIVK